MSVVRAGQLGHGYWGQHTAHIDWCEVNYLYSEYIAEFFNTLSNFPFIGLGLYGATHIMQESLPVRYAIGYLGISIIGTGSFFFHASLKYFWQLCDELPMVYFCSYMAFSLFPIGMKFDKKYILGLSTVALTDIGLTLLYLRFPNPLYHQIVFACLLLTVVYRTTVLLGQLPPSAASPTPKAQIATLFYSGAASFLFGFFVWNLDNELCDWSNPLKERLGMPLAVMLEGHAWWHIFTGFGIYRMVTGTIYMLNILTDPTGSFKLEPAYWGLLPVVRRVKVQKA